MRKESLSMFALLISVISFALVYVYL